MKKLKSVFFGTPEFSLPSLEALWSHSELVAVVTQPDRPRGRGQKTQACATKTWAQTKGIPVFSPPSLRKESPERAELDRHLATNTIDFALVVAYGNLLPESYLSGPRYGCVNLHASLLPRWRGAAPIQRAIEAGDPFTGVCLQKMVMALDAGDVLAEQSLALDPNSNSTELFQELSVQGAKLFANWIQNFDPAKSLTGRPQDAKGVTLAPKLTKAEGFYRQSWSAEVLHRKVMAFDPWPGVVARMGESQTRIKIKRTRWIAGGTGAPEGNAGDLVRSGENVILICTPDLRSGERGAVEILTLQEEGRSECSARQFFQDLLARHQRPHLIDFIE